MLSDVHCKKTDFLFQSPILQQTAFWSSVKKYMGINSIALDYTINCEALSTTPCTQHRIESDLLVIIQPLDRHHSIAYVPYGPELEPKQDEQGVFLEELSECLRPFLPSGCLLIRYDLLWESYWAKENEYFDSNGWWLGPPDASLQEIRFNFSTLSWNFRKAPSNILPSNTIFLNLRHSEEKLLKEMKPKTRYNIGLSQRNGVTVRVVGLDQIEIWYQLYSDTALRNGIYLHDIEYFRAMLNAKASNTMSPADVMLLIAETEGQALAAMFLVVSHNRAFYLYGASSSTHRNMMPTYALQWEAIRIAKRMGCTEYDMFGVSPNPDPSHPMYGLYRFKTGFGGNIYHTLGCWDYPLDTEMYGYFTGIEMKGQGYRVG